MKQFSSAMLWLQKNSETLGKQYKDQWLAIGPSGVKKHSKSYHDVMAIPQSKSCVIIKIPKNPSAAYFY